MKILTKWRAVRDAKKEKKAAENKIIMDNKKINRLKEANKRDLERKVAKEIERR